MPARQAVKLHPELPVFLLEDAPRSVVYTPGHVAVVSGAEAEALRREFQGATPRAGRLAAEIEARAREAEAAWAALGAAELEPECLTLYLSNECNLGCAYCYSAEPDGARIGLPMRGAAPETLDERTAHAAAALVAETCARKGKPFRLVVHGGGEPTRHWGLLQRLVEATRGIAERHGLGWWGYIATHGVVAEHQADWLAEAFDLIGVSCDGPPDIHDRQRPSAGGSPTFAAVARTLRRLRERGAAVSVRATVTPTFVRRQAEIVSFFHEEFGLDDIHVEPAYLAKGARVSGFRPEDAPAFASHFLAAQQLAAVLGCRLEVSGVRLHEIHGPYCDVLRSVLRLTPDGAATACFLSTDGRTGFGAPLAIGRVDPSSGRFVLDQGRISEMRRLALRVPSRCRSCANVYHCARDCPDVCPVVEPDPARIEAPGFRCLVQKALGESWIRDAARLTDRPSDPTEARQIASFLSELPPSVDAAAIVRAWRRAPTAIGDRAMPAPPWAGRGFDDPPEKAWETIGRELAARPADAPLSAYVHMPFCDRKCAFCDCYALLLEPARREPEAEYVDALLREIEAWAGLGHLAARPLTTVHFGGGTPNYTAPRRFARLLDGLRGLFPSHAATEWALESTSTQLDADHLDQLLAWGFRRLHVGVQTFDDARRQAIGRREDARTVLAKLRLALERGFIVTIDLIYGLPEQPLAEFVKDIETAIAAGLDGCSLYHLNASARNRAFIEKHGAGRRGALADYLFFQVGEQLLRAAGYRKNHFAHFARPRDANLYYTHVVRGEDLVSLGTSADGTVGDYAYRHPPLTPYVAGTTARRPALEGGLREPPAAVLARPVSAALMAGWIDAALLRPWNATGLLGRWLDQGLIEPEGDRHALTANGSWFLSTMLAEAMDAIRRHG